MHLQVLHQALHISERRRPLRIPTLTPTRPCTSRSDTRCRTRLPRPTASIAFGAAEETAVAADFAVARGTAAAEVVDVRF